ncbi:MAG: hypothetical protein SNJ75_19220, partial [Gemmataceae bacterium]
MSQRWSCENGHSFTDCPTERTCPLCAGQVKPAALDSLAEVGMLETLFPEAAPVARVVPATVPGNLVANSDNSGESERFEATLVPPVTRNDPSNQPGERGGRATVSESDTLPPSPTPCVPKDKTIVPLTSPSDTA